MSENINITIQRIDPNRYPSVVNKNYIDIIFEILQQLFWVLLLTFWGAGRCSESLDI